MILHTVGVLTPSVEKTTFCPLSCLGQKAVGRVCTSPFTIFIFCSIDYMSISLSLPHCLDPWSFIVSLKIMECELSTFLLLFWDCFCLPNFFAFPHKFLSPCVCIYKYFCWSFYWNCSKSIDPLRLIAILITQSHPAHECGISLYTAHLWFIASVPYRCLFVSRHTLNKFC